MQGLQKPTLTGACHSDLFLVFPNTLLSVEVKHLTQNELIFLQKISGGESSSQEDKGLKPAPQLKQKAAEIKLTVFYKCKHLLSKTRDKLAAEAARSTEMVTVHTKKDNKECASTQKWCCKGAKQNCTLCFVFTFVNLYS